MLFPFDSIWHHTQHDPILRVITRSMIDKYGPWSLSCVDLQQFYAPRIISRSVIFPGFQESCLKISAWSLAGSSRFLCTRPSTFAYTLIITELLAWTDELTSMTQVGSALPFPWPPSSLPCPGHTLLWVFSAGFSAVCSFRKIPTKKNVFVLHIKPLLLLLLLLLDLLLLLLLL